MIDFSYYYKWVIAGETQSLSTDDETPLRSISDWTLGEAAVMEVLNLCPVIETVMHWTSIYIVPAEGYLFAQPEKCSTRSRRIVFPDD